MPDRDPPIPSVPDSRTVPRKQTRLSLVWIIPVLAAAVGAWVAVTRIMGEGPKITIVFESAEGLEAGKTKINYRGVDVGTVTAIRLSEDHQRVIATAQMTPRTEDFLAEDTRFWVVRPRISGASVTGLGTLISGAYIGMEIGSSKERKRDFVALQTPPVVTGNAPGRFFVLKTSELGSLDLGTPPFFRRLQVGRVASYKLDKDGKFFTLQVFVRAPYDQYVTANTRFWQASGIDVSFSSSGLTCRHNRSCPS
jgi:paraquat-inducible protein B